MLKGPAESEVIDQLRDRIDLRLVACTDQDSFVDELLDADVIILTGHGYTPAVRRAINTSSVRLIQTLTAGFEEIESLGVPTGVVVCNAGDAWAPSTAEHAVTLLLALTRRIPQSLSSQHSRKWDRTVGDQIIGLPGQTVALIGFGNIATHIAARLRPFDPRIVGVSRSGRHDDHVDEMFRTSDLNEVLGSADAVIITLPLTPETIRLFDAATIARMKPGAVLINVSRGAIIDTSALSAALRDGRLAGAALDVTEPEPLGENDPLWDTPNLIISPHVAGSSGPAGWARVADTVVANVERFIRREKLSNVVLGEA
jgi:phosphoglycerate dehydrogenase-like enzyme